MRSALVVFVLLFATTFGVEAQSLVQIAPGERVRIRTVGGEKQIMLVSAVDSVAMTGSARGGGVTVPLSSIRSIERSVGDRSRGEAMVRGLGRGFLIGGVGGASLGLATGDPDCKSWDMSCYSREEGAFGFGVLFGAAGAIIGAFIGAASPGEQWQRVPVPARISIAPAARGGGAVGLAVAF